jgi:hypothetical protein
MFSVTLVHSKEKQAIPVYQAMKEFSLFQKNVIFAGVRSGIESSITLAIFRDFVEALKEKSIEITDTSITGLD